MECFWYLTPHEIPPQNNSNNPSFSLQHTDEEEVRDIMKAINPNKAADIYNISPAIIKDLAPLLTPILTTLFNRCIDEHIYPDALKFTKLVEIYKAGKRNSATNYRPISLLPIIGKILDTITNRQIMTHLINNDIISPHTIRL